MTGAGSASVVTATESTPRVIDNQVECVKFVLQIFEQVVSPVEWPEAVMTLLHRLLSDGPCLCAGKMLTPNCICHALHEPILKHVSASTGSVFKVRTTAGAVTM